MNKRKVHLLCAISIGSILAMCSLLLLLDIIPQNNKEIISSRTTTSIDITEVSTTISRTIGSTSAVVATSTNMNTTTSAKSQITSATSTIITEPGHQHVFREKIVTATCDREGCVKHGCECSYSYEDNFKPKIPHEYGWLLVKASTTKETGIKKWRCVNCGGGEDAHEEVIPKKKNEPQIDSRVEVGLMRFTDTPYYKYGKTYVIDNRTWGEAPSIEVSNDGCLTVTYYTKKGDKVTFEAEQPSDKSHDYMAVIQDDGTHSGSEILSLS